MIPITLVVLIVWFVIMFGVGIMTSASLMESIIFKS